MNLRTEILDWLISKLCHGVVWGNCYYALLLYARHGGHLIITNSTGHPVIPHVAWTGKLPPTEVVHLLPLKRRYGWKAILFSPMFKGEWKTAVIGKERGAT